MKAHLGAVVILLEVENVQDYDIEPDAIWEWLEANKPDGYRIFKLEDNRLFGVLAVTIKRETAGKINADKVVTHFREALKNEDFGLYI